MIDIDMWVEIWDIYKIKSIIYIYEYIHGIYKHERQILLGDFWHVSWMRWHLIWDLEDRQYSYKPK